LRYFTKRRWLRVLLGFAVVVVAILYGKWSDATRHGGQLPAEPFRIAGNLYYVGANDVTSFLITGPEGHVLIDGGYPGTPPLIMASIAKLGFNIRDVKILVNSHAHYDHAGGLAELQKASGAQLWVSEGDADVVAAGGAGDPSLGRLTFASYLPILRYPAPRVDHRFKDGATIHVGPIKLSAHITPGHTRGCTSWSFPVHDDDRVLQVVHRCSLNLPANAYKSLIGSGISPEIREEFERSFRILRSLPVDIWITSHAREFGRYRKFREREHVADPVAPFIDREGYYASIDTAEMTFRKVLAAQQQDHP
jgi:metallo-beta-lactamase class B